MTAVEERVSVVIPCHATRRWPQLVAAVVSVQAQSPRPARIVVTVDHNDELLALARRELAGVTVVANEHPRGAAGNRNTGIAATSTPLIVLLDDDAAARPGWLRGLLAPFESADVIGTGGAIEPRWQRSRPGWFPEEFLWVVSATSVKEAGPSTVRNVWSASMALRREVFDTAGGFRVGYAPRGDGTGLEDTDLCLRMTRASGGRWVYVPDARVDHAVPPERATLRYLLVRSYREGRGKVELARMLGGRHVLSVESAYVRATLSRAVLDGLGKALRGKGAVHAGRSAVVVAGALAASLGGLVGLATRRNVPPAGTRSPAVPVPDRSAPTVGVRE